MLTEDSTRLVLDRDVGRLPVQEIDFAATRLAHTRTRLFGAARAAGRGRPLQ